MPEPLISVVIPTISGRERWLEQVVHAYRVTTPGVEIVVVTDEPSCGHAWQVGYARSTGRYVHFTADDITPEHEWWVEPLATVEAGDVPAANVVTPSGQPAHCDSPLGDMGHVRNVLVPFLSREQLEMGRWLIPIHYGSDDWVSYRAARLGMRIVPCHRYRLTHHVASEGRNYTRRHGDVATLVEWMREDGYVPPVYRALEQRLRTSATGLDNVRIRDLAEREREQLREQRGR